MKTLKTCAHAHAIYIRFFFLCVILFIFFIYLFFHSSVITENFIGKLLISLMFFSQNNDCGCTLEPPRRDGSNEYPQSMFWSKSKKNRYTPVNSNFTI